MRGLRQCWGPASPACPHLGPQQAPSSSVITVMSSEAKSGPQRVFSAAHATLEMHEPALKRRGVAWGNAWSSASRNKWEDVNCRPPFHLGQGWPDSRE